MSFRGPAEDRLAIRELLDRYDDAVARVDADDWAATWAPDAEWDLMGSRVEGREAIVALWKQTMDSLDFAIFRSAPGALEIDGDRGQGRVLVTEVLQPKGGERLQVHGRYDDTYTRSGDAWCFQTRRYQVLRRY